MYNASKWELQSVGHWCSVFRISAFESWIHHLEVVWFLVFLILGVPLHFRTVQSTYLTSTNAHGCRELRVYCINISTLAMVIFYLLDGHILDSQTSEKLQ